MKVAILTDTNSGIDEKEAASLGIYVLPMPVMIDGKIYFEGKNLSEKDLCRLFAEGKKAMTSQPAAGDVISAWNQLLREGYAEIVYIPMSSGLSSSFLNARAAAAEYQGKVFVVDDHRISVTERTAVLKAKRMADEGKSGREIAAYLEKDAYNASIYVSVSNLDHLKRGGRVTPAAAAIASVLKIKPVLTIQGEKLDAYAVVRGTLRRCEQKMIEAIKEDIRNRFSQADVQCLHIGTAGFGLSEEEERDWLGMAKASFPDADVYYDALPASVGAHTGPGTAGIGVSADYPE